MRTLLLWGTHHCTGGFRPFWVHTITDSGAAIVRWGKGQNPVSEDISPAQR